MLLHPQKVINGFGGTTLEYTVDAGKSMRITGLRCTRLGASSTLGYVSVYVNKALVAYYINSLYDPVTIDHSLIHFLTLLSEDIGSVLLYNFRYYRS